MISNSACNASCVTRLLLNKYAFSNKLCTFHLRWFATASSGINRTQQPVIKIPDRIPRHSTSILEALAQTVNYDPTGMNHMNLIDDMGTLPTNRTFMKSYLLSEESGKKAAQHAIDNWAELLQNDASEPPVKAFTPPILLEGDTETALEERISLNMVKAAKEIYHNISVAGDTISPEVKLKYLDMLCRYNCKDEDYYKSLTEKFCFGYSAVDVWRANSDLEKLFTELCGEHPQAYISMICGMCKYRHFTDAYKLYKEAIEDKNLLFPVEVHNGILTGLVALYSSNDGVKKAVEWTLVHMSERGIRPNLETFNNILYQLKLLPPFTDRFHYALQTVLEMKKCGIEPSPATYMHLLHLIYRTKYPRHNDLLRYTVDELSRQHSIPVREIDDTKYFSSAMVVACTVNDVETAHRLYKLAWKGTNKALLGSDKVIYSLHFNYFELVMKSENLETIMEVYSDITPRTFFPTNNNFDELVEVLELYDGHQYVPQVYHDLRMYNFLPFVKCDKLTSLMAAEHLNPQLQKEFARIVDDMYEYSLHGRSGAAENVINAEVLTNFIKLALNMDDVGKACDWLEKFKSLRGSKYQLKDPKVLVELAGELASQNMDEKLMDTLQVMVNVQHDKEMKEFLKNNAKILPSSVSERAPWLKAKVKQDTAADRYDHNRPRSQDRRQKWVQRPDRSV